MSPEDYPVEHSFDIRVILIREDRIAELERMVADLEARLGKEQVVEIQNREAQIHECIIELEKKMHQMMR